MKLVEIADLQRCGALPTRWPKCQSRVGVFTAKVRSKGWCNWCWKSFPQEEFANTLASFDFPICRKTLWAWPLVKCPEKGMPRWIFDHLKAFHACSHEYSYCFSAPCHTCLEFSRTQKPKLVSDMWGAMLRASAIHFSCLIRWLISFQKRSKIVQAWTQRERKGLQQLCCYLQVRHFTPFTVCNSQCFNVRSIKLKHCRRKVLLKEQVCSFAPFRHFA